MHAGPVRSFDSAAVGLIVFACTAFATGCSSGSSLKVDNLRNSKAPYYYVGRSFEGLKISYVERYRGGVASIIYGTCHASSDQGCAPPLELQHRLCDGRVTVVIFANRGRATRAADALRPLSQGARGLRPDIAFDRSPAC